jgi:hypothetical protein
VQNPYIRKWNRDAFKRMLGTNNDDNKNPKHMKGKPKKKTCAECLAREKHRPGEIDGD